jgi:hypothetical protein
LDMSRCLSSQRLISSPIVLALIGSRVRRERRIPALVEFLHGLARGAGFPGFGSVAHAGSWPNLGRMMRIKKTPCLERYSLGTWIAKVDHLSGSPVKRKSPPNH